ncbi:PLDc N-terminal domain-containing protein [Pararhodonellum marinum]|uniref:PLDc N-terminal domain-containing protein n=1 Tax=Pararhodonellum marinum TaxID=2755358 RepID=UPI00188F7AC2|nr:PLDc N-terminal domain-containing protein [Pararhodonellum marinum]
MYLLFINNFGTWLFVFFGIVYFTFWVFTLVDIIQSEFKDEKMKIIWILIVLFAQVLGPIIYWVLSKEQKISKI